MNFKNKVVFEFDLCLCVHNFPYQRIFKDTITPVEINKFKSIAEKGRKQIINSLKNVYGVQNCIDSNLVLKINSYEF